MTRIGDVVSWCKKDSTDLGIVVDYYSFYTQKYKSEYKHALLIKQVNGKHILKLEQEISILQNK